MSPLFVIMRYYWQYIKYLVRSRHRRGFGVHSPFMFYFITRVIEERLPFYRFDQLKKLKKLLVHSTDEAEGVSISCLAKKEYSDAYQQLLFRFVHALKPKTIVEMGTSIGLTGAYLATVDSASKLYTVEASEELSKVASDSFKRVGVTNVEQIRRSWRESCGVWSQFDSCDFLFFSKNYPTEFVQENFLASKSVLSPKAVVVVADIYRDSEREKMWQEMKTAPFVRVALELHHYGLLFLDENLQRESYNLFYVPPLFS